MATNYIEDGVNMTMPTITGAVSGEAFVVGDYLPCVLLKDASTVSPYNASVKTQGVFDLSVKAHDGGSNTAVAVGDLLYWTDKDTPLDLDSSEGPFGIALEVIASGLTATIKVMLIPKAIIPGTVVAADLGAASVETAKLDDLAVTAAKLAANAVETAKILDASVTSAKLAADTIQYATVEVTSEELLALNATEKELVGELGAGTAIEFISAVMFLDYGSAAYANNGILTIRETDDSGTAVSEAVDLADFLAKEADTILFVSPLSADYTMLANVPLVLSMATGESITGDSPVTVKIAYRVHDFT